MLWWLQKDMRNGHWEGFEAQWLVLTPYRRRYHSIVLGAI